MVGERLAELREQKALTLRDLEEASGIGADAISKIENGHRKPRPSTLRKLARALGVEVEDFFREKVVQGSAHFQVDAETFKILEALASREISVTEAKARLDRVLEPVLQ